MALKQKASTSDSNQFSDRFKFENKGDTLAGYYLDSTEITTANGPAMRHTFRTKEGKNVSTLGSVGLNQVIEQGATVGEYTVIVYLGMVPNKKPGKKPFKAFKLDGDDEDVLKEPASAGAPANSPRGSAVANKAAELKGQLNKTIA